MRCLLLVLVAALVFVNFAEAQWGFGGIPMGGMMGGMPMGGMGMMGQYGGMGGMPYGGMGMGGMGMGGYGGGGGWRRRMMGGMMNPYMGMMYGK